MAAPGREPARDNRITDPRALRALAHPGRYRILERLQTYGPATATECAETAGMSPSACSYHLRLLARYGFVQEGHDDERSDGRERLWQATSRGWTAEAEVDEETDEGEVRAIDMALARVALDSSDEKVLAWADRAAGESKQWREASLISNSTILVTRDELQSLNRQMLELLAPYIRRTRDPERAPDTRMAHAAVRLVPAVS